MSRLLAGKYRILGQIGKGGMSNVYLAIDQRLKKKWAIKEVMKSNNSFADKFAIKEANILKKMDHPTLPRIVDIFEERDAYYVVMDYVEGVTLESLLEKKGKMAPQIVVEWAKELATVLDYMHSLNPPIIYRDMKPSNVILQKNGHLKLVDFGIAREYNSRNPLDTASLGTRGYAAPEQYSGGKNTDERTDIYSLGMMLHHLLTGIAPSDTLKEPIPIRKVDRKFSKELERILQKCTRGDPKKRYLTCKQLLYDLERISRIEDYYHRKRINKTKVKIISLLLLIILGTAFGTTILNNQKKEKQYEQLNLLVTNASDSKKKSEYICDALELFPDKVELYLELINIYREDEKFSVEEESVIRNYLDTNIALLSESDDFSKLALSMGKLYWYYYEYGKSDDSYHNLSGMKSAIPWFGYVLDNGDLEKRELKLAGIYKKIGEFHRDVTVYIAQEDEGISFLEYFGYLEELVDLSADTESKAGLDAVWLCMNSLEVYARYFDIEGVSLERVRNLYSNSLDLAKGIKEKTVSNKKLKEDIIKRSKLVDETIKRVYAD